MRFYNLGQTIVWVNDNDHLHEDVTPSSSNFQQSDIHISPGINPRLIELWGHTRLEWSGAGTGAGGCCPPVCGSNPTHTRCVRPGQPLALMICPTSSNSSDILNFTMFGNDFDSELEQSAGHGICTPVAQSTGHGICTPPIAARHPNIADFSF